MMTNHQRHPGFSRLFRREYFFTTRNIVSRFHPTSMITTIRRGGPKRVLPPLLLLLLLCARLAAQDPASYLQRATEQFNASGFGAAGSSTQRGHLNVSDAYGSVSYAYPLASYSINGHPIRLDLNYCGSVLHTAYMFNDSFNILAKAA
jgi:hypothetical protein